MFLIVIDTENRKVSFCLTNSVQSHMYMTLSFHFNLVIEFYLHVAFCHHISQAQTPTYTIRTPVLSTYAMLDRH